MTNIVSKTSICNRGLQHLGAARILELSDDTRNARACNAAYDHVRRAELRRHNWNFSIARLTLAPTTDTDPHGEFSYIYQLPSDCLRILKPRDATLDWVIEGRKLYTNDGTTLNLRYIKDEQDPALFDAIFVEAFAVQLAYSMCEEITQSNVKKRGLTDKYDMLISDAKKYNAFEQLSKEPEEDSWLRARR